MPTRNVWVKPHEQRITAPHIHGLFPGSRSPHLTTPHITSLTSIPSLPDRRMSSPYQFSFRTRLIVSNSSSRDKHTHLHHAASAPQRRSCLRLRLKDRFEILKIFVKVTFVYEGHGKIHSPSLEIDTLRSQLTWFISHDQRALFSTPEGYSFTLSSALLLALHNDYQPHATRLGDLFIAFTFPDRTCSRVAPQRFVLLLDLVRGGNGMRGRPAACADIGPIGQL
jgi:hypothetical protein